MVNNENIKERLKMNIVEWLEQKLGRSLTEEEFQEELDHIFQKEEYLEHVDLGYESEEQAVDAYFSSRVEMPCQAVLTAYEDVFVLRAYNEPDEEQRVFTSREEGLKALFALEWTLEPSIERFIQEVELELEALDPVLAARVDIKPKREFNNDGHCVSFNIWYRDYLLGDGLFYLEAEEIQTQAQIFETIHTSYKQQGITIEHVRKVKSNFERYYECIFEKEIKGDFVQETEWIPLSPFEQGIPRWTTDCLEAIQERIEKAFD